MFKIIFLKFSYFRSTYLLSVLRGVGWGHGSCHRNSYRSIFRALGVYVTHDESWRRVAVVNRLRCYGGVEDFFFLGCNMYLARWNVKIVLLVATLFPLQRLATDLFTYCLLELVRARGSLMLHG